MKKIITLVLLIGTFISATAQILTSGKIYRFLNSGKESQVLAASPIGNGAITTPYSANDLRQQWYVAAEEPNSFYLRNAATGAYLSSPRQVYTQWNIAFVNEPDKESMLFDIKEYEGNYVFKAKSQSWDYSYAHSDAYNNIVCWLSSSLPSQWRVTEVKYSDEELKNIVDSFQSITNEIANTDIYESYLDRLFEDKACTSLISYDLSGNSDYNALPTTLRNMVDKISANDWSEDKGNWDSTHAKKYRLQLYEPYSEGSAAAGLAGIQAYTNMNNPTGIVADEGDFLYVMVGDDIPEGATLYINGFNDNGMHNGVTEGTRLHKGLNILLCNADNSHYFIYYTVNTIESGQRSHKLSDFEPIPIHIEGGRLNGFFNYIGDELYSPDSREDFLYTSSRATFPMYDLMGKYVILHFFLEDTPNQPGEILQKGVKSSFDPDINPGSGKEYDPAVVMKQWDDMCFSERILMGIQNDTDVNNPYNQGFYESIIGEKYGHGEYEILLETPYSEYFNNRMMGISLQGSLYMNATSWRTAYAASTISAILTQFKNDALWGPAHEYGHINQTPIKFAGTTEESNNLFSNVAVYYSGSSTSRCNYPTDQLKIFKQGKTYLEHGTWGTTRMFWQLWCYYHAAGYNRKFYPRLYELLRKYPLKRDLSTYNGRLNPRYDMLHFAKMCCVAAGEDLTDFFKSWGFFVPQDNYHIDDYSVYDCVLTQEDIDAVLQEIKDLDLPVNRSIILIDDRPGSDRTNSFGYDNKLCGELGGLKAFSEKTVPEEGLYYSFGLNDITITGNNPGVGFLVYSNEGELLGFSNSLSFDRSYEMEQQLLNGTATIYAMSSDNSVSIKVKNISEKDQDTGSVDSIINQKKPFDVYTLQGIRVLKDVDNSKLESLPSGIYIIRQGSVSKKISL